MLKKKLYLFIEHAIYVIQYNEECLETLHHIGPIRFINTKSVNNVNLTLVTFAQVTLPYRVHRAWSILETGNIHAFPETVTSRPYQKYILNRQCIKS